jgi:hypothetical protein
MALLRGCLCLLAGALLAVALAAAEPDDPSKPAPPGQKAADKKPAGAPLLDGLKLPPGAVVVVCEDAKEALRLVPKLVVLSPEKYQELLDQIEQLKRQLKPDRPETPSLCKLSGQVEGDLVRLRARYEFRTERPRALVALGGARAWATAATLDDDQVPLLVPADEGLLAQVETPGLHHLTVDFVLPVGVRGSRGMERGFDLGLPRAAITTLDQLDLPADASDVRVGGRGVRVRRPPGNRLEAVQLGPAEKLDLVWKGPAAAPQKGPPLLAAQGKVTVRVSEAQVTTDAELTLEAVRGETAVWRVAVPPSAAVEVLKPQAQDERVRSIELPGPQNPVLTVRLKEASAEPLQVVLQVRQPRTGAAPVGPFLVLDAFPQRGTIDVRAPADLRVRCQARGEVSQREVPEEQRREGSVAWFTYWSGQPAGTPPPPLLTLEVEPVKGAVEAHVSHTLRRADAEREPARAWHVGSKFDVTPLRTGVDRLDVAVPASWQYDRDAGATPAELVEEVVVDAANHLASIKLAQKQYRPFSVTLPGLYAGAAPDAKKPGLEEFSQELPRPVGWGVERVVDGERRPAGERPPVLDRGGQVTVLVPDGMDLVAGPVRGERPAPGTREATWTGDRAPARVELLLQPVHADLRVSSLIDVTVDEDQARVRQRLHYEFPQAPPVQVELRVPAELAGRVRVVEGGKPGEARPGAAGLLPVLLTPDIRPPAEGTGHALVLEYAVALPGPGDEPTADGSPVARRFDLPLVRPEPAAPGEARVRVWSLPGTRCGLAGGAWEEQRTELVPERDALPSLVLRGGLGWGLTLRCEPLATPLAAAVAERVLVRAGLSPGAPPTYRVRFALKSVQARFLDLVLPAPASQVGLDVLLDGKRVPAGPAADPRGRTVRVRVDPDTHGRPVILEVNCQPATGTLKSGWLRTLLQPPVLDGVVILGRVRWQVDVPPGWLPLSPGGGHTPEQRWGRYGWLLAPRPAATAADLDRWLAGTAPEPAAETLEPGLVCWSATQEPLPLLCVPQQAWLLVCSLGLLGLGLLFALAPLPRWLFWGLTVLTFAGLTVAAVLVPGVLPAAAYGCEPGLLVLLLVLAGHWLLHRRYRRQVVFLPGFARHKTGSSLVRSTGSSNRARAVPAREPSTIDEPPKRGSSSEAEQR